MYAVIKTGGRQHRVELDQTIRIDKLSDEIGTEVSLANVLLINDGESILTGTPVLSGASVKAKIVGHGRAKKIIIFKKKRRQGYHKKQGHRQDFTTIKITEIKA